ncbi:MAG: isovaleryl-CoA dehydrogenase [Proteobacteria bacterium]|nr:isovaleryl-CoA dehydrogenase [Pseudomonadota bacterium]NDC23125.1 isovaleryl-CoA dehydrogenase [Pseudomonadota bacterium]NDD03518.1 isovaleryl-CoA dehydrogenase [Pseudomonadota bacterium]NDG28026.1 isovaleryl-CoA dehydrogenase [Pseudomonadota bacterium]
MIQWTSEQLLLKKTVEDFAKKELLPKAEEIDEKETWNEEAFKKMADLGLLGITVPEEFGGINLGAVEATLVMDILGEACASTTLSYLAHSILTVSNLCVNASAEQKKRYLPKLISGEWVGAMAMTEPGAGSDALGMQTKAEKKGNKYILNGSKTYITNGCYADALVVYARTGQGKKDISTFIVEKNFPGFRVSKKLKKMGMKGSPTAELSFDNCEVPIENLIGKENESVAHMMNNLNLERITISGISLGIAKACLDYSTRYAGERTQFGTPLKEFQMVQERLAEMATQLAAGKALVYSSAQAFDRGQRSMRLGAQCKLFTAQMATQAGLDAIQILGGYGYMREYPVERFMRDAKLMEIGAGTNEVMRIIISRELYK